MATSIVPIRTVPVTRQPCAVEGCDTPTPQRRCDAHQAQLERNLAVLSREYDTRMAVCPCPLCKREAQ